MSNTHKSEIGWHLQRCLDHLKAEEYGFLEEELIELMEHMDKKKRQAEAEANHLRYAENNPYPNGRWSTL